MILSQYRCVTVLILIAIILCYGCGDDMRRDMLDGSGNPDECKLAEIEEFIATFLPLLHEVGMEGLELSPIRENGLWKILATGNFFAENEIARTDIEVLRYGIDHFVFIHLSTLPPAEIIHEWNAVITGTVLPKEVDQKCALRFKFHGNFSEFGQEGFLTYRELRIGDKTQPGVIIVYQGRKNGGAILRDCQIVCRTATREEIIPPGSIVWIDYDSDIIISELLPKDTPHEQWYDEVILPFIRKRLR